jgi:hypothetical protein
VVDARARRAAVDDPAFRDPGASGAMKAFFRNDSLPRLLPSLPPRAFFILFALGLFARLLLAPLYGTQDVEWQKAWGTAAVREGVAGLYGSSDAGIVSLWKQGKTRAEIRAATQKVIPFEPHRYSRTEYRVTYPPLYVYGLYGESRLCALFSPGLGNGRLFNVCVNLLPILASALLTLALARFSFAPSLPAAAGPWVALAYWLNPVTLLNSPIQGYQDPMCALFAVLSVLAVLRRRVGWAGVLLALGILIKPQAVLVAPVVLAAGWFAASPRRNLAAWGLGFATALVVLLPYLANGRTLSVVQGVLSIRDSSQDISRQALNAWWPLQYVLNALEAPRLGVSRLLGFIGGPYPWDADMPASRVALPFGISLHAVGWLAFGAFTLWNLRVLARRHSRDSFAVVPAAALQVYAYFILCVGVQINHYQILIPLLLLSAARPGIGWRLPTAVCGVFLLQDLIFYGLGRDFNPGRAVLSLLRLGWTTNVLAILNVALFVALASRVFRGRAPLVPEGA